jgi:hypothetical protein
MEPCGAVSGVDVVAGASLEAESALSYNFWDVFALTGLVRTASRDIKPSPSTSDRSS